MSGFPVFLSDVDPGDEQRPRWRLSARGIAEHGFQQLQEVEADNYEAALERFRLGRFRYVLAFSTRDVRVERVA